MEVKSLVKCVVNVPVNYLSVLFKQKVELPEFKGLYVVRDIFLFDHFYGFKYGPTVLVEEIANPIRCEGCKKQLEVAFPIIWFEELQAPGEMLNRITEILTPGISVNKTREPK